MDQKLIEQITRLVISQLEGKSDSFGLTKDELKKWNEISMSLNGHTVQPSFLEEPVGHPLTNDEIKTWNELNKELTNRAEEENERATFIQHN